MKASRSKMIFVGIVCFIQTFVTVSFATLKNNRSKNKSHIRIQFEKKNNIYLKRKRTLKESQTFMSKIKALREQKKHSKK